MSDIAIRIDDLWKKYKLGKNKSLSFRESFSELFSKDDAAFFWALKSIDLEIKKGEAVGIIGANGAGKSTLLKILSKISYPTKGKIEINGRVSSLLEVGTGFHPELTGRQNIFLNGTILGMTKKEVTNKFDEIVAFSGVEKFIDTPVKRYSSGMKVRLAFSVAAHLEPEILIIDEVLAVGDAEFQQKCLGKMEDVSGEGRTVLFVSHNMAAVKNLCNSGVVLKKGETIFTGNASDSISAYGSEYLQSASTNRDLTDVERRNGTQNVKFSSLNFKNDNIRFEDPVVIEVCLLSEQGIKANNIDLAIKINNSEGITISHLCNRFVNKELPFEKKSENYQFKINHQLRPGTYFLTLFLRVNDNIEDWIENKCSFTVVDSSPYPHSNVSEIKGLVFPEYEISRL